MKKIYIAGKIAGDSEYLSKFFAAEQQLRQATSDAVVLNPARNPEGLSQAEYMRLSFAMIDAADCVVALPDACISPGARLELCYCEYTGKPVRMLAEVLRNGI